MSNTRLSMRKVREILRLTHEVKLSCREVALSAGVSVGVVSKVINRAKTAGLTWAELAPLDEAALEVRLNGPVVEPGVARDEPDPVLNGVNYLCRVATTTCAGRCQGKRPPRRPRGSQGERLQNRSRAHINLRP